MKTLLRWIIGLVATLLLLGIALGLAVTFLFDPNDYKDDIAALVSEQTGRPFSIEGDLSLNAFPCCGIALGPLSLGNPPGFPATPFARVERAMVDLQLWPLLVRQELRIGNVELQGFDAQLISRADGSVNWEFTAGETVATKDQSAAEGPVLTDLAIAGIVIRDGRLGYSDEATGDALTFSDINLTTSTIRQGKPFDLDASLAADGVVPDARAELQLNAQLYLDSETGLLDVMQLYSDVGLTGDDLPGGAADIAVDLAAARGLGSERVALEGLAARIKAAGISMTISGDGALVNNAPELKGTLSVEGFSPQRLLAALDQEPIVTQDKAVLQRAELKGDWTYAGDKAALENFVGRLDDTEIKGWVRAASIEQQKLVFDLQVDTINLDRYAEPADPNAGNAAVPGKAVEQSAFGLPVEQLRELDMEGRIGVGKLITADAELSDVLIGLNAQKGRVRLSPVNLQLDGSVFAGDVRLDVTGSQPKLAFELQVDSLDLDRYIESSDDMAADGDDKSTTGDEGLDLPVADLRQLHMDGRMEAGKLKFSQARLRNVNITISARNGVIRLNPLTAKLYGGSYAGDMQLDVTGNQPKLSVNEKLAGVKLGPLLKDASKIRNLEGISDARVTATATGNSVNELLANLAGDASLDLRKGVFKGVDLWYEIRKARALLKKEAPPPEPAEPSTDISKLSGTAKFADGQIANNDFVAQASFLGVKGKGTVDLLQSTLDYRLEAKVEGTPTFDDGKQLSDMNGLVLPVTIKGKLAAPAVKVDVGAMALNVGKRKLLDRLEKKLGINEPAETESKSTGAADAAPDQQAPTDERQESAPEDPKEQLKKRLFKMLDN